VLSTLRGGILPDVIEIRHDPAPGPSKRIVVLTVSAKATDLTVGGQDCRTLPACSLKLALRAWYVDLKAGERDEPRLVALVRLEGEKKDSFYSRLGVKDVALPALKGPAGYAVIYLPHDAFIRVDLKRASGDKAPNLDVIGGGYNVLRLVGDGRHWFIRLEQQKKLPLLAASGPAGAQ
jgi:hypothetical protein